MDGRERGSVLPLVALLMAAIGGLCLVLGQFGGRLNEAAQARTAADAAALAGAADGRGAARDLAEANHGALVEYRQVGPKVTVRVQVGDAVARATAVAVPRFAPATLAPRSPSSGR